MELHLYDDDDAPVVTTGALTTAEHGADTVMAEIPQPSKDTPVTDRRGYIGGSDAACIAGLSPWKTPYDVYLEKIGERESADLSGIERVYWGSVLEEIIVREYAQRTERKVRRVPQLLFHNEHPFIAAHIDRIVLDGERILEAKTSSQPAQWGESGSADIPDHYMPQVQHNLAVTGRAVCDVPVLFFGSEYRIFEVPRDDEFISSLIEIERDFWKHVVDRTPPMPKSSDEANKVWPHSRKDVVRASLAARDAARDLYTIRSKMKELEEQKDALETLLKSEIADIGDTLMHDNQKLATWKTQTTNRFDGKAFGAEHSDLYEQYKRESESRVFRFTYKGE